EQTPEEQRPESERDHDRAIQRPSGPAPDLRSPCWPDRGDGAEEPGCGEPEQQDEGRSCGPLQRDPCPPHDWSPKFVVLTGYPALVAQAERAAEHRAACLPCHRCRKASPGVPA